MSAIFQFIISAVITGGVAIALWELSKRWERR